MKQASILTEECDFKLHDMPTMEVESSSDPVHVFYINLLCQALQDLGGANSLYRENAYYFFVSNKSWLPYGISYKDVIDNINLSIKYKEKVKVYLQMCRKEESFSFEIRRKRVSK